ncbi:alpha carbonic anhydrase [Endogone sp. FLAS-F59071]|nr:alpha carbonic anhydrase [Endogone sp. FLAS-F59071]|eukprot:RUS16572.1 alpha carbonic anhydrase [Endogone sp. FLAS-F59071]
MLFAQVTTIIFTVLALGLRSQAVYIPGSATYNGITGPAFWGKLSPNWTLCDMGLHQSPIDLDFRDIVHGPLQLSVPETISVELQNNGHTLQANVPAMTQAQFTLILKGQTYQLQQFHLHTPSEHRVNGKFHDLELHFLWKTAAGASAVTAVFYNKDQYESEFLKVFTTSPPTQVNATINITSTTIGEFFNKIHDFDRFYHYDGSLTIPPCTEGVDWYIYPDVQSLNYLQHELVSSIMGFNARFTQASGISATKFTCSHFGSSW